MLFGERLALVRKKKKISQDELAKAIGVHAPVIGHYERGEVKPSICNWQLAMHSFRQIRMHTI